MVDVPFKKISPVEYELQLNGRTKTIKAPFAVTEKVFQSFISSGGVIDPVTGMVQQDVLQLISSFKDIGNILLSEWDDEGHLVKEGNCAHLGTADVINLFLLASEIVSSFIVALTQMQPPKGQPENQSEGKAKAKTKD